MSDSIFTKRRLKIMVAGEEQLSKSIERLEPSFYITVSVVTHRYTWCVHVNACARVAQVQGTC